MISYDDERLAIFSDDEARLFAYASSVLAELKAARDFIADYDRNISTEALARIVKRLHSIDVLIAKAEGK